MELTFILRSRQTSQAGACPAWRARPLSLEVKAELESDNRIEVSVSSNYRLLPKTPRGKLPDTSKSINSR